jgi:hypothetical protein
MYGHHIHQASLFMPVRAQDHYILNNRPDWGNRLLDILFQPFQLELGEWERLANNTRYRKPDKDGLVVATLQVKNSGEAGWIIGQQTAGNETAQCGAATVWGSVLAESFCMPVVRGNDFQVDLTVTGGEPTVDVFWIPLGSSHKMLSMESRDPNTTNKAEINGILTGCLHATRGQQRGDTSAYPSVNNPDDTRATLNLMTAETGDFPNSATIARTSVQLSERAGIRYPYNSATTVVRKGSYYRAQLDQVTGSAVTPTIKWIGIVPA